MSTASSLIFALAAALAPGVGASDDTGRWIVPARNPANGPGGKLHPTYPSACDGRADASARPAAEWLKDAVIYPLFTRMFSPEGTFRAAAA